MLKETSFRWHTRKETNIPSNPIKSEFCIVDFRNGIGRMYKIKPICAQNADGMLNESVGYKYFVFFCCNVRLASEEDRKRDFFSFSEYAVYVVTLETFIAIFDTMEDAKKRAYTQYKHHSGYVLSHVVDDIEKETQKHFIVE